MHATPSPSDSDGRVLILNPSAGSGDHVDIVRDLATERGFRVQESSEPGDPVALARDAAHTASVVAAAGGDGTVNEVIRGIVEVGALEDVSVGVVPVGTGNNFAGNLGITGVEHALDVIDDGNVRTIDVGIANGRPFLNSCIGGLTAEASAATTSESKARFGVLAYVLTTLQTAVEFDGLPLYIETAGTSKADWSGDAAFVLIGNGRRFPAEGRSQAHMEDGLLDVTVVEDQPTFDVVGEAALNRLLGAETSNIVRFKSPELSVTVPDEEPATFSLDGEMTEASELSISTRERVLQIHVGESYDPQPD